MAKQRNRQTPGSERPAASKVRDASFDSAFFTVRTIKRVQGEGGEQLIMVAEMESVIRRFWDKPQFVIDLDKGGKLADSARALGVGDIFSTVVEAPGSADAGDSDVGDLIFQAQTPFVKVEILSVVGVLATDPVLFHSKGGEEAVLLLDEYSSLASNKYFGLDWRKVYVPHAFIESVSKLRTGDQIVVDAKPRTYFNVQTRTNDIMWDAVEKVKKRESAKS